MTRLIAALAAGIVTVGGGTAIADIGPLADQWPSAINQHGQAIPCGLWVGNVATQPGTPVSIPYSVGNCHRFTIRRRIILYPNDGGVCRTYSSREGFSDTARRNVIDLVPC
jgi:hypothetical protein